MGHSKLNKEGAEIDPLSLSQQDVDNGGYIPEYSPPSRATQKRRTVGGINREGHFTRRDLLTQGQMRARIAGLWRDGIMYKDICETINAEYNLDERTKITPHAISSHIKAMIAYWREQSLLHIDERQAAVLARYEQIETLATEAYFKSTQGKYTTNYDRQILKASKRQRHDELVEGNKQARKSANMTTLLSGTDINEALVVVEEKIKEYERHEDNIAGDPRYLAIMIDINDKRARLWGLLNRGEQTTSDQEMARLTDEARTERITSIIQQARSRANGNNTNLAPSAPLGGFAPGEEPTPGTRVKSYPKEEQVYPEQELIDMEVDDDFDWE